MDYRFTHVKTSSAIGFFTCLPHPTPDLDSALALLALRQNDKFLQRYCLELLLQADANELAPYAKKMLAYDAGQKVLAEAAPKRPELEAHIAARNQPMPNPSECQQAGNATSHADDMKRRLYANIHQHMGLELAPSDFESAVEKARSFASASNQLAARYSQRSAGVLPDSAQDLKSLYEYANRILKDLGLVSQSEMRHEASLAPIALLREWNLDCGVDTGATLHTLKGAATAYGRGLSLAQAKISCVMEIVERASAFASVTGSPLRANGWPLHRSSRKVLAESGAHFLVPRGSFAFNENASVYWREGADCRGSKIFIPAQSVYLFLNLDEPPICEQADSTGLGAGQRVAQAKLAALCEVLERYAHATTPFLPERCFQAASRDPVVQGLLDDFRWRGIHVQFQDITTELGLPAYRCFVKGLDCTISQASGAHLSGKKAALAALTETPWPYSWSTCRPSPSARAPVDQPVRYLEDLPDYELGNDESNLKLLEDSLLDCGLNPVYIELTRPDIALPVFRCLLPALETDSEFETNTGEELLARLALYPKG